jgi:hypothetical protein
MEFMDEVPERGVGVGLDMSTNKAFLKINEEMYWMDENQIAEMIAALIIVAERQDMNTIARWN